MYKSLLRKNRIPSTALESLKGALSCSNFFSCSYETVSISVWGCFLPACPNKGTGFKHFVPNDPQIYSSPRWKRVGRGIPGQGWAMALKERAGKAWCKCRVASLSNKWVSSSVNHGLHVCHEDCQYLGPQTPDFPHRSPTVT